MAVGKVLLITGSTGRLGRALQAVWQKQGGPGFEVIGLGRRAELPWRIGIDPAPDWPEGAVLLHLAGVVAGEAAKLAQNAVLTEAVCQAALQRRARHVLVASSVAVYRPGPADIPETQPPDPQNPYGKAKLAAEEAARRVLARSGPTGLTLLRLGNVAGADALLGHGPGPLALDPVAGQARGPERSYIGPVALAGVIAALVRRVMAGDGLPDVLPDVLNVAQPPVVAMADLLDAAGADWQFGPPRLGVVPRVGVATTRLQGLMPLPRASADSILADLRQLKGLWP